MKLPDSNGGVLVNVVGSSGVTVSINSNSGGDMDGYDEYDEYDYELEYLDIMLDAINAINKPDGGSYFRTV